MEHKFDGSNPEYISKLIHQWIDENGYKILAIVHLGYGWEAWLQADLGFFLQNATGATLHRESLVYPDNERVDLTIWDGQGNLCHYFEFKCKSEKSTPNNFLDGLKGDWDKVQGVVVGKDRARAWAIGFYADDNAGKPTGFANWIFKTINGVKVLVRAVG